MDVTFLLLSHPWSYNRTNSCSQSTQSECSIRLSLKKLAVYKPAVSYLSLLSIKASKVSLGRDETLPQTSHTRTILSQIFVLVLKFFKMSLLLPRHDFYPHPRLYPHPRPTTSTHDPRPTTVSYTLRGMGPWSRNEEILYDVNNERLFL